MKHIPLIFLLLFTLLLTGCGAGTPAVQSAEAPAAVVSVEDAALTAVLDEIRDSVHPGTAGGSLRAAIAAAALLDWAEAPQEGSDAAASAWLEAQTEDARALLPEQIESLRGMVERLTADYEASAGLLEDAGLSGRGPWSEQAAQTALALLDTLG